MVVLHLENGPPLVLHPLTARDLMLAQAGTARNHRVAQGVVRKTRWGQRGACFGRTALDRTRALGIESMAQPAGSWAMWILKVFKLSPYPSKRPKPSPRHAHQPCRRPGEGSRISLDTAASEQLKGLTPTKTIALQAGTKRALVFIHGTFSTPSARSENYGSGILT